MIVFQPNQLIKIQIEDANFWITPLTWQQRQEIMTFKKTVSGEVEVDTLSMAKLALKYGLKKAQGLLLPNGDEFQLDFSDDGKLIDEHCDLLLNSSVHVHAMALKLSHGIILKSQDGVTVTYEGDGSKKKKLPKA